MTTPDLSPSTAIGRRTASRLAVLLAGAAAALAVTLLLAASGERAPLVLPHIGGGTPSSPSVVPNAGQTAGAVRFEARAGAGAIYFTRSAVVLAAPGSVLRLRHEGTSGDVALRALDRRPGVVNVLRGERSRWRTGLPTYGAVLYRGLYPGVDLRVDGEVRGGGPWVRPTYAVAAHTSPSAIRWRYAGAASVRVDRRTGELQVLARAGAAPVVLAPPVAWQMLGGARVPVPVDYRAAHDGSVGFTVGRHDRGQPLLISGVPAAQRAQAGAPRLRFSTFLGGTQWDEAYGLALDPRGGAFIAGFSQSRDFPTAGRPSGFRGVQDAVVSHFDVNGRLVYSTYLGGSRTDTGQSIAVDAAGNAYVTGRTESPDFPVLRAMQPRLRGHNCQGEPCHDAFVTKLDARGRPVYSTFFGG